MDFVVAAGFGSPTLVIYKHCSIILTNVTAEMVAGNRERPGQPGVQILPHRGALPGTANKKSYST